MTKTITYAIVLFSMLSATYASCAEHKPIKQMKDAGKKIALTFDDGPEEQTLKIIKLIKAGGGKATFFVKGKNVKAKPAIAKTIIEEGFEIGNHSWSHPHLPKLTTEKIREELQKTQDIVKETTGFTPVFFRAPFLNFDDKVWAVLDEFKLPAVNCNIGTKDWDKNTTKEMIVAKVKNGLKPGSVVLMHSWPKNTLAALPEIIQYLKDNGYEMVTMSELAAAAKTAKK